MSGSRVDVVYKDFEKLFVKNTGTLNSLEWLKVLVENVQNLIIIFGIQCFYTQNENAALYILFIYV